MKKVGRSCLFPVLVLAGLLPYPVGMGLAAGSAFSGQGAQSGSAPSAKNKRPPSKQAYPLELPEIKRESPEPPVPPAQPPKYGFVRGTVVEVSCQPAQGKTGPAPKPSPKRKRGKNEQKIVLILSVKAKSKTLHFFKDDISQVAMLSGPEEGSICESIGRAVGVNYLEGRQSGYDGEIFSVELTRSAKPPQEPTTSKTTRKAGVIRPRVSSFHGTVERVSCGQPMVFSLRGKDRSGKVRTLKLRATSTTEFFALTPRGTPAANFDVCQSTGLAARATYRTPAPSDSYDGELTRVDFTWIRK